MGVTKRPFLLHNYKHFLRKRGGKGKMEQGDSQGTKRLISIATNAIIKEGTIAVTVWN